MKIHKGRPKQSQITFKKINPIEKKSYASNSMQHSPRYSEIEEIKKPEIKKKEKIKKDELATKV